MNCRLFYVGTLFGWLFLLLSGCTGNDGDNARIPPPYTADFEKRREDDRLAFLSDCIRRRVDPAGSYYKRAKIYLDKGEFEAALSDINQAISGRENVGEYYLLRGIVNRELNRLEAALLDAERAEALQQKSPGLYVLMADILQENKKYNEAKRYINGVLAFAPYDASVYYVQGMLQINTGDTLTGLGSIEKALNLNPRFFRAYQRAASLYLKRGDYENSARILRAGMRQFPASTDLLVTTGRLYSYQSKPDSALIYYKAAYGLEKSNPELLTEMAGVYIKARNYRAALALYENLQKTNPEYPAIHFLIGFCQEKLWRYNVAKSYYEKELELTPGYLPARNGLWRISQLENQRLQVQQDTQDEIDPVKTLDDSRLDISPIQPRKIQE